MSVIERINILLKENGMTGAELCRAIGVSTGVYSQWNTGRNEISAKNLKKIADFFSISVSDLLGDEDNKKTATPKGDGTKNAIDRLMEEVPNLTLQQAEFLLPQVLGLISSQQDQDGLK